MPAGTPGAGYKARAAFRIVGLTSTGGYPTAIGTPTPDILGAFDLIPFLKEGIAVDIKHALDDDLQGYSAQREMTQISRMAGGSLDLQGRFLGLNQLILACLGFERIGTGDGYPPVFEPYPMKRYGGAALIGGITTGATSDTLSDTNTSFPTSVVGEFVQVNGNAQNPLGETRRIIARPSVNQIQVYPAWTGIPPNSTGFVIARTWLHTYELSRNMHQELVQIGQPSADSAFDGKYITRRGVLGIDKGVSVWEWQACYVESMTVKLDANGLTFTFEIVPFWKDRRTTGRNSSATNWAFHPESYAITRRIRLADTKLYLGAHVADNLGQDHLLGINSLELRVKNNLKVDDQSTESGLYRIEPGRNAKREVSGSITVPRYSAETLLNHAVNGTGLMAQLRALGPDMTGGGSDYAELNFYLRYLKLLDPNVPVEGPGLLGQKFNFTCLQPPSQSGDTWPQPSADAENGELIVTSHDTNPFGYMSGHHWGAY